MATIQSLGATVTTNNWQYQPRSLRLYNDYVRDYGTLYKEQPNMRVCVEFLGRNIGQLGLHFFRRRDDNNRERVTDHPLPQLLQQPLPPKYKVTYYRLIEAVVSDLGIYANAYWLKLKTRGEVTGLLRIPPEYMTVGGGIVIGGYEMQLNGIMYPFAPEEIVHFRGYNPLNPILGLSPAESLRRILAEDWAMGNYREQFWQNAARIGGIVKRPAGAPEWSEVARERFRQEFEELYTGEAHSGRTAILEEGMEWEKNTFSAEESEYLAGRKLTREECARAYFIPPPLVGILDHATFSNISEQHKHLYQDTLGPTLAMLEQDIIGQLAPDFPDADNLYAKFNIREKLEGDFMEQVSAMQSAVGRPYMTANEARSRLDMPPLEGDADQLVTPLNVMIGGQASPRDSAPDNLPKMLQKAQTKRYDASYNDLRPDFERQFTAQLQRHYARQERVIKSAIGAKQLIGGDVWFDAERWNRELSADLYELNTQTAVKWAKSMAEAGGWDVSERRMENWLKRHSEIQADGINRRMREHLDDALNEEDRGAAVANVFMLAATVWAAQQAVSMVTSAASFGASEAANAGRLRTKTWQVNSANPRESHAALNGETVGIRETFSNGLRWPGDPEGSADDNAGCQCSVIFG